MNLIEIMQLRATYRARLAETTQDSYLTVLHDIFQDIEKKVKNGLLTTQQGEELVRALFGIALESYSIDGLESLSEGIEKGYLDISFDANDSIASMVAALKVKK
ncbi:hypothetical protein [Pectobacterium polaris]|uniref:hypothetical protein n=1 Tax=Pectobacterium polaris TaxID=2042057 RepID=UPI0019695C7D|nr:hypothetical protein [Pectobacterium polaris]MBN3217436.1 hypothetical protein [Pectobacterium polaris]